VVAKFSKSEFAAKFQREVPLLFEIHKFPYNTVWHRWKESSMPNPASFVQSLRCNTGLVADGRRDRRTHDDSIYRASIATSGKKLYELRMSLSKRANAHANLVGLNLLNSGLFCFKV